VCKRQRGGKTSPKCGWRPSKGEKTPVQRWHPRTSQDRPKMSQPNRDAYVTSHVTEGFPNGKANGKNSRWTSTVPSGEGQLSSEQKPWKPGKEECHPDVQMTPLSTSTSTEIPLDLKDVFKFS
jgi:hypothetical protein